MVSVREATKKLSLTSQGHTCIPQAVNEMATRQPKTYPLIKIYSRSTETDTASTRIPVKLALGIPAIPPDDGDGLGCCAEVDDVIAGVDPGADDDGVATVLDGVLVVALLAVAKLPVGVTVAASAMKELRIDE
jgi:hypothetical protein